MNTSSYFPHNINARSDEKIIGVRMDLGCEGYGIYFMLLEKLGESEDYTCVADYKRIAFDFHCEEEKVKAIVENYGLFRLTEDGSRFYSQSYNERMQIRDEKSIRRAEAGRIGGKKAQELKRKQAMLEEKPSNAQTMLETELSNATENSSNKIKGKEIKENIKENPKEKPTLDFDFIADEFKPIMQLWLDYKKERHETYKPIGWRQCYKKLLDLSNKDPILARQIIEQSMANNYQGFFPLKNNQHYGTTNTNRTSDRPTAEPAEPRKRNYSDFTSF